MRKARQQVLILCGRDRDGHVLDFAPISLVGRVVLDKSVKTVMSNSEHDVLCHIRRYPGKTCLWVLIIAPSIINPEAHRMNPLHPRIDCGQRYNTPSIICFGVLGVSNHWVSFVLNSHVLVAIRCPSGWCCRCKVSSAW